MSGIASGCMNGPLPLILKWQEATGKILLGGECSILGGQPRSRLGRLYDGRDASSRMPSPAGKVAKCTVR